MSKHILFYSEQCDYSNKIRSLIKEQNMSDEYMEVCIDNNDIILPSFVTMVPTLYIHTDKLILIDDDIEQWINNNKKSNELDAYSSNVYCSINGIDNLGNSCTNNYSSLTEYFTVNSPKETDNKENNTKGSKLPSIDKIIQERNNLFKNV